MRTRERSVRRFGLCDAASMLLVLAFLFALNEAAAKPGTASHGPPGRVAVAAGDLDPVEALAGLAEMAAAIRFFHPSDGVREVDWGVFLPNLVQDTERAADPEEWAEALRRNLESVAPLVVIRGEADGEDLQAAGPDDLSSRVSDFGSRTVGLVRWHHRGLGAVLTGSGHHPTYRSELRQKGAPARLKSEHLVPVRVELHPGLHAVVPTMVPVDSAGRTLPYAGPPESEPDGPPTLGDSSEWTQAVELASILTAWGALAHFYPNHDLVQGSWPAALREALGSVLQPKGGASLEAALERMLAHLEDGHAHVLGSAVPLGSEPRPPVHLAWLEDELVIWGIGPNLHGVAPGDRIHRVNGIAPAQFLAQVESRISAATDGHRRRVALEARLPRWLHGDSLSLEVETDAGERVQLLLPARGPDHRTPPPFQRPQSGSELVPGVVYLNLGWGATTDDFHTVFPSLERASGIVVDLRGYPGGAELPLLARLARDTLRSPGFWMLEGGHPEKLELVEVSPWTLAPASPHLGDRPVVFLTDESAISRSETVLMIVRHHALGEIVGSTTAGTNGDMNFLRLPSGQQVTWTGLRVRWTDGTEFHGQGVAPDLEVRPTRAGVREGRDEVLESGVSRVLERLGRG